MRRVNYEVKDNEEILKILKECETIRIAMNDDGYPYVVPVNYGVDYEDGKFSIYIHGADAGKKKVLLLKDNRVGFEVDYSSPVVVDEKLSCDSYVCYRSVCGKGNAYLLKDEEKIEALTKLMRHYTDKPVNFSNQMVSRTMVIKIDVTEIVGKFLEK